MPTYGLQICQATGPGPDTVYPILRRLENIGRVRPYWDERGKLPAQRKRPLE